MSANDLPVGRPLAMLSDPALRSIAFSPDYRTLAAVGYDGKVRLLARDGQYHGRRRRREGWSALCRCLPAVAARWRSSGVSGRVWRSGTAAPPGSLSSLHDPPTWRTSRQRPDRRRPCRWLGAASHGPCQRRRRRQHQGLRGHTGIVTTLTFSPMVRWWPSWERGPDGQTLDADRPPDVWRCASGRACALRQRGGVQPRSLEAGLGVAGGSGVWLGVAARPGSVPHCWRRQVQCTAWRSAPTGACWPLRRRPALSK